MENTNIIINNKKVSQESLDSAHKKFNVVRKFIHGQINIEDVAYELSITKNYSYTLIKRYNENDGLCYLSKKIGVPVNKKIDDEFEKKIVECYQEMCRAFAANPITVEGRPEVWFQSPTFNLFYDRIKNWVHVGKSKVIEILKINKIVSPRTRKVEAHNDKIKVSDNNRCKLSGFEVQLDGKVGIKFPDDNFTCVAHSAVDAGTNEILGIVFEIEEMNCAYIKLIKHTSMHRGVPRTYVTDNRSCFTTNREMGDKNVIIARGLRELCELITTSNATRKNKVESKNDVIQMRVLPLLMLAGIRTMKEANDIIQDIVSQVNQDLNNVQTEETFFTSLPKNFNFDEEFSAQEERSVHIHSQIQYQEKKYFLVNSNDEIKHLKKKQKVTLFTNYNGNVHAKYKGNNYNLIEATKENRDKYCIQYLFKERKIYKKDRNDFSFRGTTYHMLDNLGNAISIKAGQSLTKCYDENSTLLYVLLDGIKYYCNEGKNEALKESEPLLTKKEVNIKYDGTFKLNNHCYSIKCDNVHVVFPDKSKIKVYLENGIPSHIIHKKKMLTLHNLSISSAGIYLPKSHLEATRLWNNSKDIVRLEA